MFSRLPPALFCYPTFKATLHTRLLCFQDVSLTSLRGYPASKITLPGWLYHLRALPPSLCGYTVYTITLPVVVNLPGPRHSRRGCRSLVVVPSPRLPFPCRHRPHNFPLPPRLHTILGYPASKVPHTRRKTPAPKSTQPMRLPSLHGIAVPMVALTPRVPTHRDYPPYTGTVPPRFPSVHGYRVPRVSYTSFLLLTSLNSFPAFKITLPQGLPCV